MTESTTIYLIVKVEIEHPTNADINEVIDIVASELDYDISFSDEESGIKIVGSEIVDSSENRPECY